ncbi:hypothetical protein RHMOL_Rhmol07G0115000 [Rhododendron molle]|uniref:Uncharacterized protein n=1 Tax=Rhododendron molle TaxID=49168 RepID=A0ACC0MZB9_RHOML|nr:hypothetical protein RHMOL_Rhmol07G0115000 [Rhododendron molle]
MLNSASVYYILKERNGRVFQQVGYDSTSVERLIVEGVKASMSSWSLVTRTAKNLGLILDWGLSAEMLCNKAKFGFFVCIVFVDQSLVLLLQLAGLVLE